MLSEGCNEFLYLDESSETRTTGNTHEEIRPHLQL